MIRSDEPKQHLFLFIIKRRHLIGKTACPRVAAVISCITQLSIVGLKSWSFIYCLLFVQYLSSVNPKLLLLEIHHLALVIIIRSIIALVVAFNSFEIDFLSQGNYGSWYIWLVKYYFCSLSSKHRSLSKHLHIPWYFFYFVLITLANFTIYAMKNWTDTVV